MSVTHTRSCTGEQARSGRGYSGCEIETSAPSRE